MEKKSSLLNKILPLFLFIMCAFCAPKGAGAQPPSIHFVTAEGIINPVMAEYLVESIEDAAKDKAGAVIIQLDTPGGLDLSMREIIKAMLASDVPVVVYVAPAGSRAASAGVFIAYAANFAAMAPGTNIGSAHPVAMGGQQMDEAMAKKVENDAVAYIQSIAKKRGRNADWAQKAVRESVNITAEEALRLGVIDTVAASKDELIKWLDGRKTEVSTGIIEVSTKGAQIKEVEMDLRARVLNAITNPNVAYILMMIGIIGLYFELANPGLILPGVLGAVCLVLAFYAFHTLSVNYAGLILIALGAIFFIVELMVVSYGLLAIAGVISIVLGSLMLFDSPQPFMRVSMWVLLPTVIVMTAAILGIMYYAYRVFRKKPVSGAEGLVGAVGKAVSDFKGGEGKVFLEGEYWDATSQDEIKEGDRIKVIEMTGLILRVKKD